ncbi:MAG: transporter substrate-binding domain-containing protein [Alphaproteobacteria bacterium]|nr:transporter substrate-binding domain-containing protein [Alphaproteobacteria bacterium]
MVKRALFYFFTFLLCLNAEIVFAKQVSVDQLIFNNDMLNDAEYTFAVQRGTYDYQFTMDKFPSSLLYEVDSYDEGIQAVADEKVDAFIMPSFLEYHVVRRNPNLVVMPEILQMNSKTGISIIKSRPDLLKQFNHFIATISTSGVFDEMYTYWLRKNHTDLPKKFQTPKKATETITVAVEHDFFPMSFLNQKGEQVGYYIEFLKRFALFANININIVTDSVDRIQEKMKTGEYQVFASNIKETKERLHYMNFTEGFLDENFVTIVRKERMAAYRDLTKFNNKKIGTLPCLYETLENSVPMAQLVRYVDNDQIITDFQKGEIDVALLGYPLAMELVQNNPKYTLFPTQIGMDKYSFFVRKTDKILSDQIENLQKKLEKNGTLKSKQKIWFGKDENLKVIKSVPNGKNKIKVGYIEKAYPFSYDNGNGEVVGFSIDLLYHYLSDLGYGVEILKSYNYETIFEALEKNEIDIAVGDLSATRERAKKFKMLNSFFNTFNVFVVPIEFMDDVSFEEKWWDKLKKIFKN